LNPSRLSAGGIFLNPFTDQLSRAIFSGLRERSHAMERAIVINGDEMGQGDEELGRTLMKNFLAKLMSAEAKPKMIVLYNSAVKLAARGSEVLESLHSLENLGVEIICCGTCVNHYGLADQIEAGRVTNMPEIVKVLTESQSVVTL
jgi:selenium metabolism protein YedF